LDSGVSLLKERDLDVVDRIRIDLDRYLFLVPAIAVDYETRNREGHSSRSRSRSDHRTTKTESTASGNEPGALANEPSHERVGTPCGRGTNSRSLRTRSRHSAQSDQWSRPVAEVGS